MPHKLRLNYRVKGLVEPSPAVYTPAIAAQIQQLIKAITAANTIKIDWPTLTGQSLKDGAALLTALNAAFPKTAGKPNVLALIAICNKLIGVLTYTAAIAAKIKQLIKAITAANTIKIDWPTLTGQSLTDGNALLSVLNAAFPNPAGKGNVLALIAICNKLVGAPEKYNAAVAARLKFLNTATKSSITWPVLTGESVKDGQAILAAINVAYPYSVPLPDNAPYPNSVPLPVGNLTLLAALCNELIIPDAAPELEPVPAQGKTYSMTIAAALEEVISDIKFLNPSSTILWPTLTGESITDSKALINALKTPFPDGNINDLGNDFGALVSICNVLSTQGGPQAVVKGGYTNDILAGISLLVITINYYTLLNLVNWPTLTGQSITDCTALEKVMKVIDKAYGPDINTRALSAIISALKIPSEWPTQSIIMLVSICNVLIKENATATYSQTLMAVINLLLLSISASVKWPALTGVCLTDSRALFAVLPLVL